ncbi:oxaloacetate decarboxylase, gamma chain [Treponema socranskii subsp. socranskii VPI DR56BR1116 = ATCC 35536]|nr:oxaloacetate decarboxylase, gamma chain [Treponema socranskii subsp. socranskii VPI DR56BR1116 = ATCC 35536]
MYLLHVVLRALKLDNEEKKETVQSPAPALARHDDAIIAAIAAAVHK